MTCKKIRFELVFICPARLSSIWMERTRSFFFCRRWNSHSKDDISKDEVLPRASFDIEMRGWVWRIRRPRFEQFHQELYELICRRGLAFQIFKVHATYSEIKSSFFEYARSTCAIRYEVGGDTCWEMPPRTESEVSRNVQSTRLRINYYIRERALVSSIKIYFDLFDGNRPRSIPNSFIFSSFIITEWFESTIGRKNRIYLISFESQNLVLY